MFADIGEDLPEVEAAVCNIYVKVWKMDFFRKIFKDRKNGTSQHRSSPASSPLSTDNWREALDRSFGERQPPDADESKSPAGDQADFPAVFSVPEDEAPGPVEPAERLFRLNETVFEEKAHLITETEPENIQEPPETSQESVPEDKSDDVAVEPLPPHFEDENAAPSAAEETGTATVAEADPQESGQVAEEETAQADSATGPQEPEAEPAVPAVTDKPAKKAAWIESGEFEESSLQVITSVSYRNVVEKASSWCDCSPDEEKNEAMRQECRPIIDELLKADTSIQGAAIFLQNGTVLLKEGVAEKIVSDAAAVQVLSLSKLSQLLDAGLYLGGVEMMQLSGGSRKAFLFELGPEALLAIWADRDIPQGIIILEARDVVDRLKNVVQSVGR